MTTMGSTGNHGPHPSFIMLLLWLLPLLFQPLPPQRFTNNPCIMSEEWETTTSRQRRDRRRREQRGKGPPVESPQLAAIASPPAAEADADANIADAVAALESMTLTSTSEVPKPFVLLLAGLPGSGKSTLAEQLMNAESKYVHVNQDTLGTRKKCLAAVRNAVLAGTCPIVDRCNFDATQRKWFVDLAKELSCAVHCVVLVHVDRAECLHRCKQRRGHPTLPPSKAAQVIGFVQKDWRLPTEKEGIDRIRIVTDEKQYQDVVAFYS